jgi:hypothetical protein
MGPRGTSPSGQAGRQPEASLAGGVAMRRAKRRQPVCEPKMTVSKVHSWELRPSGRRKATPCVVATIAARGPTGKRSRRAHSTVPQEPGRSVRLLCKSVGAVIAQRSCAAAAASESPPEAGTQTDCGSQVPRREGERSARGTDVRTSERPDMSTDGGERVASGAARAKRVVTGQKRARAR